ncbi:hypothetical protein [uncultured Maribacter sp.]|uniref:hypothetical protein n=1 Tax=uncultured Maribacter sp. TaxID=431308 RepID=UPI0030EBE192|tara:strand:+ start:9152 stop:9751 length:600 start_codon:yes stop_codon:yes gene_type:complete
MTNLTPKDIEDFWIRVYLNPKLDFRTACANRSYRDLNRTIHGMAKNQSKEKYQKISKVLIGVSDELINMDFNDQISFDISHELKCIELIKAFKTNYGAIDFTIGQAQKWINMNLKYLFALGESRVPGITKNYIFFHIPIDNIIQDLLLHKSKISRIPVAWSRMNNYDMYINYQREVRRVYAEITPMDVEFRLFNEVLEI